MSTSPRTSNDPVALDAALVWRDDVLAFRHLAERGVVVGRRRAGRARADRRRGFAFARLDAGVATATIPAGAIATVVRADAGYEIIHGPAEARLLRGDVLDLPHRIAHAPRLRGRAGLARPRRAPRSSRARRALPRRPRRGGAPRGARALAPRGDGVGARGRRADARPRRRASSSSAPSTTIARAIRPVPLSSGNGDVQGVTASARAGDGRAGGGQKAAGAEGKMGDRDASSARHGRYAVPERAKKDPAPSLAREEALSDAAEFGMIGLLGQGPAVPVAAAWDARSRGPRQRRARRARRACGARETGQYQGLYGLGLSGIGEGGGGRGEGIGLGNDRRSRPHGRASGIGHRRRRRPRERPAEAGATGKHRLDRHRARRQALTRQFARAWGVRRRPGERSPPARGHPAHRPPELRPLPPLLREGPRSEPDAPGARRGALRHRSRRRGLVGRQTADPTWATRRW